MKLAKTIRRLVLVASLVLPAVAGCKDKGSATTPRTQAASGDKKEPTYDTTQSKSGPGWRWEGARGSCFYLVEKTCFETQASACKAAGCELASCNTDGAIPARVSCKKK